MNFSNPKVKRKYFSGTIFGAKASDVYHTACRKVSSHFFCPIHVQTYEWYHRTCLHVTIKSFLDEIFINTCKRG